MFCFELMTVIIKIFSKNIFLSSRNYLTSDNLKIWCAFLLKSMDCEIEIN